MDFTIDRADMLAAIDKCALATEAKHATEAFRLMLVDATRQKTNKAKETARFAAVGETCTVDTVVHADIKEKGDFVVMPGHLRSIVASMPPGRVRFSLGKDDKITVKSLTSSRKATFKRHTHELRTVEDPGKGASWSEVDARELSRALGIVKTSTVWVGRDEPSVSLLIPTERGLDVFGCNSYTVALVETSIRMSGDNVQVPAAMGAALSLMLDVDDKVSVFSDGLRTYFQNCDTLVSALLADERSPKRYKFQGEMLTRVLDTVHGLDPEMVVGPSLKTTHITQGLKSVQGIAGFASGTESGDYGYKVHVVFGKDTVIVELGLADADARDEFDVITSASELEFWLGHRVFEQMLAMLSSTEEVQAVRTINMLLLRSQGIVCGILEQSK